MDGNLMRRYYGRIYGSIIHVGQLTAIYLLLLLLVVSVLLSTCQTLTSRWTGHVSGTFLFLRAFWTRTLNCTQLVLNRQVNEH